MDQCLYAMQSEKPCGGELIYNFMRGYCVRHSEDAGFPYGNPTKSCPHDISCGRRERLCGKPGKYMGYCRFHALRNGIHIKKIDE